MEREGDCEDDSLLTFSLLLHQPLSVYPSAPASDMVADIIRDSTFGQIVNYLSKGKYFPYADQRPDYVPPAHFLHRDVSIFPRTDSETPTTLTSAAVTLVNEAAVCSEIVAANKAGFDMHEKDRLDAEKQLQSGVPSAKSAKTPYPWLVTFDENDPDRPM